MATKKSKSKKLRNVFLGAGVFILVSLAIEAHFLFFSNLYCGGFTGRLCPKGFTCLTWESYPDAPGRCLLTPLGIISSIKNLKSLLPKKSWSELKTTSEKITYQNPEETTMLHLTKQGLTDFPQEILGLINLKVLDLSHNKLTTLPKELEKLQNLEVLYLEDNQFSEFPLVVTKLTHLKSLSLSGNNLKEIPKEIASLQNLENLRLERNKLESLPAEIVNLKSLKEIYIGNNLLTNLPQELNQIEWGLDKFFIVQICPNPFDIDQMPKKFLLRAVAYRYFYETSGNIYEETALAGEGITHLARRVVDGFLEHSELFGIMKKSATPNTESCLEDFLQNRTGREWLKVGEKRTFSADLLEEAIFSCRLIERICP